MAPHKLLLPVCMVVTLFLTLTALGEATNDVEPTPTQIGVVIPREIMVFSRDTDGYLRVLDVVDMVNRGSGEASVEFALPHGSEDVTWQVEGEAVKRETDRLILTSPLQPGQSTSLTFSFRVTGNESPMTYRRSILYPTQALSLLVRSGDLRISGLGLADLGESQIEDVSIRTYQMDWLQPTTEWQVLLTLSGMLLHDGLPLLNGRGRAGWFVMLILGVGILVLSWVRRYARKPAASQFDDLVEQLTHVEMAYRRNELEADDYWKKRHRLEKRLMMAK